MVQYAKQFGGPPFAAEMESDRDGKESVTFLKNPVTLGFTYLIRPGIIMSIFLTKSVHILEETRSYLSRPYPLVLSTHW